MHLHEERILPRSGCRPFGGIPFVTLRSALKPCPTNRETDCTFGGKARRNIQYWEIGTPAPISRDSSWARPDRRPYGHSSSPCSPLSLRCCSRCGQVGGRPVKTARSTSSILVAADGQ